MTAITCQECGEKITQPHRPQGGGNVRLFCSHRCRSREWARANRQKRKAAVAKYEAKPEVRRRRGEREKWRRNQPGYALETRMRKYRLAPSDHANMVARQQGKCAGCREPFSEEVRDCVDHDHNTGRVRGLLCDNCNVALGRVKDNAQVLYRLAAHLELDRSRPVVYLVGSLRNPKVIELGNEIRAVGIECLENWMAAGPTADDSWQHYSNMRGRTYQQALDSREAKHVFHFDKAYIDLADAVVLLYPAGRSGHLEFGYAVGQGKRGYMLMEEPAERYDVMLQFAGSPLFSSKEGLLVALREDLKPLTMEQA